MKEMHKYKKEVGITYFKKEYKTTIDDVNVGDIIFIKVKSPLNYGISEIPFYGKLVKKTKYYFDILEYYGQFDIDNWHTEQINLKENNPKKYTKRWAKKSIIEIYNVSTEEKTEIKEFYTNKI